MGTYTSPHLRSFAERIEVDGAPIPDADFAAAVARVAHAAELVNRTLHDDDRVTQFEALTAAAYHELARRGVEVAVIEAGLGGRYDATNVIPSSVQVLTSVGLEHTRWLGPTVRDIAEEKLAVVRDHATLVVPPDLHPDAMEVALRVAGERHADVVEAGPRGDRAAARARLLPAPQLRRRPRRRGRVPGRPDRRARRSAARPPRSRCRAACRSSPSRRSRSSTAPTTTRARPRSPRRCPR